MKLAIIIALFACMGLAQAAFVNFSYYDWMQNASNQGNTTSSVGNLYFMNQSTTGSLTLGVWFTPNFWSCGASCAVRKEITVPNNKTIFMDSSGTVYSAVSWLSAGTGTIYLSFSRVDVDLGSGNLSIFKGSFTSASAGVSIQNITLTPLGNNDTFQNYSINVIPGDMITVTNKLGINSFRVHNLTIQGELVPQIPTALAAFTNTTQNSQPVLYSVLWQGNDLTNYTFSLENSSGVFVNSSVVSMTGSLNWSNITGFVNSTIGNTVHWIVYAWNSTGAIGVSSNSFIVTGLPAEVTAYSDSYNYTEGSAANITARIRTFDSCLDARIKYNVTLTNGTGILTTRDYSCLGLGINNFSQTVYLSNNSNGVGLNESQNVTVNVTLYTNGIATSNANSSQVNLSVYPMMVTNCTFLSSVVTLNMSVYNETNSVPLNESIIEITTIASPVSNLAFTRAYAFTLNTTTRFYNSACIYPQWATYTLDNSIVYYKNGYAQRSAYSYGNFSNVTQNMSLYLLPLDLAEQVIIYVVDENGNTVEGVTVKIQRWFVGNNTYATVATILTDFEGKGSTYLYIPDTFYRFILEINGTVQSTTSPTIIICRSGTCPPYTLTLPLSTLDDAAYFTRIGNLAFQCSYSNATNSSVCTVYDVSGIDVGANLTVKRLDIAGYVTICSDEQVGSSVTLTCALGATAGKYYQYFLYAKRSTGEYDLLESGVLDFHSIAISWGLSGILLGFLLFLTLVGAGAWNPVAGMVLGFIGLVAGYFLHILPVDASVLIGLGAVVGLAVWKMRS